MRAPKHAWHIDLASQCTRWNVRECGINYQSLDRTFHRGRYSILLAASPANQQYFFFTLNHHQSAVIFSQQTSTSRGQQNIVNISCIIYLALAGCGCGSQQVKFTVDVTCCSHSLKELKRAGSSVDNTTRPLN